MNQNEFFFFFFFFFEKARQENQSGIDQLIERISNDKGIHKNHFSERKSHVISE